MNSYPQVTEDGRTVWACCVSSIGPTCQHLLSPSDAAAVSALRLAGRWDAVSRRLEDVEGDRAQAVAEVYGRHADDLLQALAPIVRPMIEDQS